VLGFSAPTANACMPTWVSSPPILLLKCGSPPVLCLHCGYAVVTLWLRCCYTVVTLLLHYGYTVLTLLLHWVTVLLHCCILLTAHKLIHCTIDHTLPYAVHPSPTSSTSSPLVFSPHTNALSPQMMDNLMLEDGGDVEICLVSNIPLAKKVTFRPQHHSFALLPTPRSHSHTHAHSYVSHSHTYAHSCS
jgi:hypothetical protein